MLTLFFFKPIFPVGKLIEDITGNLLGKHLTLSNRLGFPFGEFVPISPTFL